MLQSINKVGTTISTDRWYDSKNIIDQWLPMVLEEARVTKTGEEVPVTAVAQTQWAPDSVRK